MENIPNASPDINSEVPPSYPGSTTCQTPVLPEPVSYPATTCTFVSELPPSNPSSSNAILQPKGTSQHTTVAVVTSQPLRQTHVHSFATSENVAADSVLYVSVCCCIACFLCGSPLTIFCFVPAIMLALKVKYCTLHLCSTIYTCIFIFKCRARSMHQMVNLTWLKRQSAEHVFWSSLES